MINVKEIILNKKRYVVLLYLFIELFLALSSTLLDNKILIRWTGALFGIGILISYYVFIFYPGYFYARNRNSTCFSFDLIIKIILVSILSCFFVYLETKNSQTIYIWDSLEVWQPTLEVRKSIYQNHIYYTLKDIYHSINYNDYNKFLPLLLSLPFKLTGKEFHNFVLCGWIVLGIPATLNLSIAILATLNKNKKSNLKIMHIYMIILLIAIYEIPLLLGYMNIAMIATGSSIWILFLQIDLYKIKLKKCLYLALLAIVSVIQSRTAAYMVVGAFFAFFVKSVYRGYHENKLKKIIGNLLCSYFIIGASAASLLLLFFHHFFIHALTYDISIAYSAYAMGTHYLTRILLPFKQMGVFVDLFLCLGIFISATAREYREEIIFLITWLFTSILLISRIQLMNINHIYIVLIPVAGTILITFNYFYKNKNIMILILGILILGFTQAFTKIINKDLCSTYTSVHRYDINTIGIITNDLIRLTTNKDKVYILASSGAYNQNTFNKYYFPYKINSIPNALRTHDVDLRDGFPIQFFDAKYILVLNPIQTHLRPKDQSVVTDLAKDMLTNTSFSRHYTIIKSYELHQDKIDSKYGDKKKVTAYLYKKITPLTLEDIKSIEHKYVEFYPNYPELFKNRIDSYIVRNSEKYN